MKKKLLHFQFDLKAAAGLDSGILPAIVLTAAFYSFHHAGFQPEFTKLFFVGILYTAVFYLTKNILVIFPFFAASHCSIHLHSIYSYVCPA